MKNSSCDYLIIGGGSAGAIVARRLSDAGAGDIILLEAGKSDRDDPSILQLAQLDQQSNSTEWGFLAKPHRRAIASMQYSRAKMLGGCGGHNDCAFLIPPDLDFERWQRRAAGDWSAAVVRRYFDRVASMVWTDIEPPVSPVSEAFLKAGNELGLATLNQRGGIAEGVGAFPLNCREGVRQSASVAYLHSLAAPPRNLEVRCDTLALELIFDRCRAFGCRTDCGEVYARKEVILACGSIQSPQLLMVSGVGPAGVLATAGVNLHKDLPGVGQNLLDHPAANIVATLDKAVPPWALTPCEVTLLLRSNPAESAPDLLYHFVLRMREKYGPESAPQAIDNGVKISPNVARPRSRGWLTIESADFTVPPHIELNYFSDPDGYDMHTLIQGLRYARRLIDTDAMQSLGAGEVLPGPDCLSDAALTEYILDTCETVYHPAGTCRMGEPDDPLAVVDHQFKVRGFENLRVVDASVFPEMVTVNINNTVMMVAERAADSILATA